MPMLQFSSPQTSRAPAHTYFIMSTMSSTNPTYTRDEPIFIDTSIVSAEPAWDDADSSDPEWDEDDSSDLSGSDDFVSDESDPDPGYVVYCTLGSKLELSADL